MIIGVCGLIGSGKGTAADMLVQDHGFQKISFADKLKDGVATVFGWNRDMLEGDTNESREWREKPDPFWTNETGKDITPRLVLQLFGTDCMRSGFFDGIWVSLVKQKLVQNPDKDFVIPDVRFRNEQDVIRDLGGKVWQVKRGTDPEWFSSAILDNQTDNNLMSKYDIHPSEWKWIDTNDKFDSILYNNGTIEDLKNQVLNHLA
jgi:hypothetical protein|tara:strand:- start:4603 stop:5214 length:612 start_codon:yes stop_codon:yes gene_type:complete